LKKKNPKRINVFFPKAVFVIIKEYLISKNRTNPQSDELLFQDPYYNDLPIKHWAITNAYRRCYKQIAIEKENSAITATATATDNHNKNKKLEVWFPKGITHTLRTTAITQFINEEFPL